MFCNNCGKELENGAKFCNNCGAPQQVSSAVDQQQEAQPVASYTQPAQNNPYQPQQTAPQSGNAAPYNPNPNLQPPVKPKKSSTGCIVAIIVGIVVFVIAIIAIAGIIGYSVTKNVINDTDSDFTDYSDTYDITIDDDLDDDVVTGLTYEEIFTSNYIVEVPSLFLTKETCALAYAETNGYVEKSEYGYENDVIKEMVDTYYFPIDGYNEKEREAYITLAKVDFVAEESLSFCTVTYSTTTDYFIATVRYDDVDNKNNLKEMYEVGLLDDNNIDYLSMEETEKLYIEQGFVKK